MSVAEFVLARIAEDEATAQAAGHRLLADMKGRNRWSVHGNEVRDANGHLMVKWTWPAEAAHIARHDPVRVLAECAAKRAIVEMHRGAHRCPNHLMHDEGPCRTLLALAQACPDHPDYDPEWSVAR